MKHQVKFDGVVLAEIDSDTGVCSYYEGDENGCYVSAKLFPDTGGKATKRCIKGDVSAIREIERLPPIHGEVVVSFAKKGAQ